ncbi:MAG TPA: hypothetical protein VIR65_14695 [Rhizorhapis sp.]
MLTRFRLWFVVMLISWDQWFHCLFAGPKYIIVGGPKPNPDETISSKVGRQAIRGKRWALLCEAVIDWFFCRLGSDKGHCRAKIEWTEVKGGKPV